MKQCVDIGFELDRKEKKKLQQEQHMLQINFLQLMFSKNSTCIISELLILFDILHNENIIYKYTAQMAE